MRSRTGMMLACATAGLLGLTAVSRGAGFVENFSSGDVTDGGNWATGVISNPANVGFTEPAGGPLTIAVNATPEGGFVQTTNALNSAIDFTTAPMLLTLTPPAGGTLNPPTGGGGTFDDRAKTYLGVDVGGVNSQNNVLGSSFESSRPDSGVDRLYLSVNSGNALQMTFTYWDSTLAHPAQGTYNINMSFNHDIVPTGPTISITSMFLYADGADISNGNFYINGGVTWVDSTNPTVTNTDWLMGPVGTFPTTSVLNSGSGVQNIDPATGFPAYDIGRMGGNGGGNFTAAEDLAIQQQFAGNVHAAVEVQNINASATSNSVAFGGLTAVVPEPTSLSLVAIGAGLLFRRSRGKASV